MSKTSDKLNELIEELKTNRVLSDGYGCSEIPMLDYPETWRAFYVVPYGKNEKISLKCLETKINLILNHLNLEVDYIPPTGGRKVLKKKKIKKTGQK